MPIALDHAALQRLESQVGDSFFVFDLERFATNCDDFLGAFRAHYPNSHLAWSYKTNYLPALCRLVDARGGAAEVVSRTEYDLALRLGVPPERIVFNGPYKRAEDIDHALSRGVTINLDGHHQVGFVRDWLARRPAGAAPVKVGLRVGFALPDVPPSRFGFDADRGDAQSIARELTALPGVALAGLHCHFATITRSPGLYAQIAGRMLALSDEIFGDRPPDYLDLGGGYASRMPGPFGDMSGIFRAYGGAVAPLFRARFGADAPTRLVLEPGYALVADTADFVARVLDRKVVGPRTVALVSGSLQNIKPSPAPFPVAADTVPADPSAPGDGEPVDLVGYTCVEYDVLSEGYAGGAAVGDYVVFRDVGAYTNVLQPPFIRPSPAIVAPTPDGGFRVLKRAQSFDDFFGSYVLD